MTVMDYGRVRWLVGQVGAAANGIHETRDPNGPPVSLVLGLPSGAYEPPREEGAPPVGTVPQAAFGNTMNGRYCHTTWQDTASEVATASGHLRVSLEADVARLDAVIHAFEKQDWDSADELCAASMRSGSLDVFNTHLDSQSADRRELQAGKAVDTLETSLAPTIFTGDFNTAHPPEVGRLIDDRWQIVSNDADDQPINTFHDRSIDKIYTTPGIVVTNPAVEVAGQPSDHDALLVELAVAPPWP
ncbi:MAG TPA: endonuclease/exonuclease/phosphatase family protein [Micromonosporaceae bacterium]|nr:endonuclease/exonuclease/phosphatase family protein [Micromonosporaceae bacterium]